MIKYLAVVAHVCRKEREHGKLVSPWIAVRDAAGTKVFSMLKRKEQRNIEKNRTPVASYSLYMLVKKKNLVSLSFLYLLFHSLTRVRSE